MQYRVHLILRSGRKFFREVQKSITMSEKAPKTPGDERIGPWAIKYILEFFLMRIAHQIILQFPCFAFNVLNIRRFDFMKTKLSVT